jgi:hypothetical protein
MIAGLSYFLVCALSKLGLAWWHEIPWSAATIVALIWQDALMATILGLFASRWRKTGWTLYALLSVHLAICLPLLILMATPLTKPLLLAARGTLSDSIHHHLNTTTLAPVGIALLLSVIIPLTLHRSRRRKEADFVSNAPTERGRGIHGRSPGVRLVTSAATIAILGFLLMPRADVNGLHRNVLVALLASLRADSSSERSLMQRPSPENFYPLKGVAAGWNVLLIALESTGSRFLKSYGAEIDPMPNLTRLCREGFLVENAYAPYPESVKGLFAVLASRYPKHGLTEGDYASASPSLATVLGDRGYETALFHSGRFVYLGMDTLVQHAGFNLSEDAGTIGGQRESSFGVDDEQTVTRILNWLNTRAHSKPFLIHYLPISGHHPYDAPKGPWETEKDHDRYLNALHYSDQLLGRLVSHLTNTLVVIYGDHGEAFGEHAGNYGHTLFLYEENVRVPLIVWAPGIIPPGRTSRVTSLIDIAPTICDLLGVPAPATFQGLSLLAEFTQPALFMTDYSLRLSGLREGPWKYIHEQGSGFRRLYNLSLDPAERTNLAGAHPAIVESMHAQLFGWNIPGEKLTLRERP